MFSIFVEVPLLFVLSTNEYTKEVKIKGGLQWIGFSPFSIFVRAKGFMQL